MSNWLSRKSAATFPSACGSNSQGQYLMIIREHYQKYPPNAAFAWITCWKIMNPPILASSGLCLLWKLVTVSVIHWKLRSRAMCSTVSKICSKFSTSNYQKLLMISAATPSDNDIILLGLDLPSKWSVMTKIHAKSLCHLLAFELTQSGAWPLVNFCLRSSENQEGIN